MQIVNELFDEGQETRKPVALKVSKTLAESYLSIYFQAELESYSSPTCVQVVIRQQGMYSTYSSQ
jgi:hypothetical protein